MNQHISFIRKIQLLIVSQWVEGLNFWLNFFQKILFKKLKSIPENILIYKIGNIGDIVCAVPSFIAIRRNFPNAKITLLTSPGKKELSGAKELLNGARYVDKLEIYYTEDIDSFKKKKKFIKNLRQDKYDLFIQLPDDLANFRTLLRNMIFAKLTGAKSAFGFKIRTVQLFKKTQVDYSANKTEVESLLDILKENDLAVNRIEFDFNVSEKQREKVKKIIKDKWGDLNEKDVLTVLSAGGKRATNRWPLERFGAVAKYLQEKYNAKIIITGGKNDISEAENTKACLQEKNVLIVAGELEILETLELLKHCSFLISNSTGTIHLAAAVNLPVVGLFGIRDVFGRWFPYGNQHKILYHKFLDCDYRRENCVKKSVEMITVEEAIEACDSLIGKIKI